MLRREDAIIQARIGVDAGSGCGCLPVHLDGPVGRGEEGEEEDLHGGGAVVRLAQGVHAGKLGRFAEEGEFLSERFKSYSSCVWQERLVKEGK